MTAATEKHINRVLTGIVVSIFAFLAHRIYVIETNHLSHIEQDIAVMQTELTWAEKRLVGISADMEDINDDLDRIEDKLDQIIIQREK
jgi:septal ring factor EnvC (AmiA/AmiB activator)